MLAYYYLVVFVLFCFEDGAMLVVRKDYGIIGTHSRFLGADA